MPESIAGEFGVRSWGLSHRQSGIGDNVIRAAEVDIGVDGPVDRGSIARGRDVISCRDIRRFVNLDLLVDSGSQRECRFWRSQPGWRAR